MKWMIVEKAEALAQVTYQLLKNEIQRQEEGLTIGLATGSSPVGVYEEWCQDTLDCSHVTTVNLDEYVGLSPTHPQSYHTFMKEHLFNAVAFKKSYLPFGDTEDAHAESERYEHLVRKLGVDLQLLGIGSNGHIAFNEPGTSFDATTHVTKLTESTREANQRFFDKLEDVPSHAITMGLGTIMEAKKILLVASSARKAEAVRDMMEGPATTDCPATILQRHADVMIVLDEEAAALLSEEAKRTGRAAYTNFIK
ncbi:glucosamine-6-phosphate deaminase [Exiguobacterium oxidotolerans]|uniref:Glucosamine-6-phosphate deaminase n=1 Tax=Exiguobacterium oxidotolerans TaxID=223958 RepID=A0A653IHW6_9BACL|nr:glucosamine-6-phosphate deaminase [Exiguobacterium oxidotolerans]VWX38220.1 Glucosamine-6-phosphate deaminase [Exiguobacterium oxidotolerans]